MDLILNKKAPLKIRKGLRVSLNAHRLVLYLGLPAVGPDEVDSFVDMEFEVGLLEEDGLLHIVARWADVVGWSGATVFPWLEPVADLPRNPLADGKRLHAVGVLVDTPTNTIMQMRVSLLSPWFSSALETAFRRVAVEEVLPFEAIRQRSLEFWKANAPADVAARCKHTCFGGE